MRLVFAFLLLLLSGCASPPKPLPDTPSAAMQIALTTMPNPPRPLDQTAFTVELSEAQKSGTAVKIALAMPSMTMPDNTIICQPIKGGYRGVGRFTMAGDWTATVTVSEGTRTARKTFSFQVH